MILKHSPLDDVFCTHSAVQWMYMGVFFWKTCIRYAFLWVKDAALVHFLNVLPLALTGNLALVWPPVRFQQSRPKSSMNDAACPTREQAGNICRGRNHIRALNQASFRQPSALSIGSDGEWNWGLDRFNRNRWEVIRLGEGGCLETWGAIFPDIFLQ